MKYIDREGNITTYDTKQDELLARLYGSVAGRMLIKPLVRPWVSKAAGRLLDKKFSKILIKPFVKKHKIDLSVCCRQSFVSYNDFFTRQLRRDARPIEGTDTALISPCDGKLSVYPVDAKLHVKIKHTDYTLSSLLASRKLAEKYAGGTLCVFRLTVDDYHRFCYVDEGEKSKNYRIAGVFHTVNPVANDIRPIYKENTREFSLLKSRHFKTVLMMEVGALMVGRIVNHDEEAFVKKGQEKGMFEFGGSTVILLFQKGAVELEQRLLKNTKEELETIVKMGERLGEAAGV